MDVIISSLNPAKISAVEAAFNQTFPDTVFNFIGVSVNSGVPVQPMSCIYTK